MTLEPRATAGPAASGVPRVSVVTPFYNTAPYLAECIESVLAQTFTSFEYLLVNNRSTDGSREIARRYAERDLRIRLIDNEVFVSQVENYNGALAQIDPHSSYCKLVQADDALEPRCLELMVEVAERDSLIGLVSSYYMEGDEVSGAGIPRGTWRVPGKEACRRMLLDRRFFVGSPTTVLYRANLVRARRPFYAVGRYFEDTEAAYEILLDTDLGFVHQVLSFSRTQSESTYSRMRDYNAMALDYLINAERFGPSVLTPLELKKAQSAARRSYFGYLARGLLRRREADFWDYHRRGLATIGWPLRRWGLAPRVGLEALRLLVNPQSTIARIRSSRRTRLTAASPTVDPTPG